MTSDINYDHKYLEEILGCKIPIVIDPVARMTARALTDSRRAIHPNDRFRNAVVWLNFAFDEGKKAGIAEEKDRWQSKLKRLFDL